MKRPHGRPIIRLPERPYRLRGGGETFDPRLDRLVQFDEESRNYPIRALIATKELRSKTWASTARLDQGEEGACVGFAWSHELEAEPDVVPNVDTALAHRIYEQAQTIDEWPGEEYSGTSVLAGAKVVQEMGHLAEYRWAFGIQDVLSTLSWHGPVVLGIKWYYEMYYPNQQAYVVPQGQVAGGHAILAVGYDHEEGEVWLQNSWGPLWGRNGLCRIKVSDLDALLQDDGEACVPVVRTQVEQREPREGRSWIRQSDGSEEGSEEEVPEPEPKTPSERTDERGDTDERQRSRFADWLSSVAPDTVRHREAHDREHRE